MSTASDASAATAVFITPEALLEHWQGHRRLTRRVIEAFPDDQLFTFSVGGMRTFGELAMEMLSMAAPMVRGVHSGDWNTSWDREAHPKVEILRMWDESTEELNRLWPQIPAARFGEQMTAFGQYPGIAHDLVLYVIDNEIHHRGQGYVYLRALGVEPPPFYER
ncbi:MAG TPA: DinB family protein [Longimicrobium sp.]